MKTIGIVGGMSWESTTLYYQLINREVRRRCGALHSAPLLLHSLDFEPIVAAQRSGAWDTLAETLAHSARGLEAAGAELLVIATNTMHRVADEVQAALAIPLLHIVDATAAALQARGCRRLALLGTRYTMEQPFWTDRLARAGVCCLVPDEADRALVHRVIFDELCRGEVHEASRRQLQRIVRSLAARGATGVALGCTELSLILAPADVALPLFDTTRLHALAAVDGALAPHALPLARAA